VARHGTDADEPPLRTWAAIVLAGGRGTRLGRIDKPAMVLGGRTLVAAVVDAAACAAAHDIVVVGPPRPELTAAVPIARCLTEQPAGCGPVPALRAGLDAVAAPWIVLLAADLPFLRERHLLALLRAAGPGGGAVLADDAGRPQWLASCWQAGMLRAALAGYQGSSLRGLLAPLRAVMIRISEPGEPPAWLDCDTAQDLAIAQTWAAVAGLPREGTTR
jgi:molybdopterin-guanine dinucleotide biosynthesis protein A